MHQGSWKLHGVCSQCSNYASMPECRGSRVRVSVNERTKLNTYDFFVALSYSSLA